jgi:hypothetical protein
VAAAAAMAAERVLSGLDSRESTISTMAGNGA